MNTGNWLVLAIGVLGSFAGVAALLRTFQDKPLTRATAMGTVNSAAISTLTEIKADNNDMRQEMTRLRSEGKKDRNRIDQLEDRDRKSMDRIDQLEDREDKYVKALQLLSGYVAEMHERMELANLVAPPEPISPRDLQILLNKFATETPVSNGN